MKKFVLCLFAAFAAFTLATGASALTNSGGVIGATENIVGGVVEGAENIVGGVARGAQDIVGGTHHGNHANHYNRHYGTHGTHGNHINDNKDGVHPIPRAHEGVTRNENHVGRAGTAHHTRDDRNPATAVGFGIIEIATVGAAMLGTAAIAGGKKRK